MARVTGDHSNFRVNFPRLTLAFDVAHVKFQTVKMTNRISAFASHKTYSISKHIRYHSQHQKPTSFHFKFNQTNTFETILNVYVTEHMLKLQIVFVPVTKLLLLQTAFSS